MLNITAIRVRHVKVQTGKLKAVVSLVIDDCFAIHDIKIIMGADGPFVVMPSRKLNTGEWKDVAHPLNTDTRLHITGMILDAYFDSLDGTADGEPSDEDYD